MQKATRNANVILLKNSVNYLQHEYLIPWNQIFCKVQQAKFKIDSKSLFPCTWPALLKFTMSKFSTLKSDWNLVSIQIKQTWMVHNATTIMMFMSPVILKADIQTNQKSKPWWGLWNPHGNLLLLKPHGMTAGQSSRLFESSECLPECKQTLCHRYALPFQNIVNLGFLISTRLCVFNTFCRVNA